MRCVQAHMSKKVVVRKCVQVYDISFRLVVRERRLFSATLVMETLGIEIMLYSMFSTMFSIMLYIMLYSMLSIMLYTMLPSMLSIMLCIMLYSMLSIMLYIMLYIMLSMML